MRFHDHNEIAEAAVTRRSRRVARAGAIGAIALLASVAAACNSANTPTSTGTSSGTTPSVDTLIAEGQAAQNAGDPTQAVSFYKQAIQKAPNNATALYDLADVQQIDLKDNTDAETNYRKALAINPNFENALFNLAILVTNSNPTEAEAYYEQIIAIDPKGSASSHLNLGYIEISQGKVAEGDAEIREAARMNPAYANRVPSTTTHTSGVS